MKKYLKPFGILLSAGIAFSACTGDDALIEQNAPQQEHTWAVTATIGKDAEATTRSLTLNDNTLNVGWTTTEKIYAKKAGGVNIGYLSPTADTDASTTTVSGMLNGTDYTVGEEISLVFPRAEMDYTGQDGTLATIAANYDYATATTTIASISGSNMTLAATTLTSQQAIVKFTFSDAITELVITSARLREAPLTIKLASAQTEVFAAMPLDDGNESAIYQFTGYNSNTHKCYEAMKSGVHMQNGKYYTANVNFTEFDAVSTPLTFEVVKSNSSKAYYNGAITIYNLPRLGFKYRKNGGDFIVIEEGDSYSTNIDAQPGDIIQIYGDNTKYSDGDKFFSIVCYSDCYVYGNFMSLINSTSFSTLRTLKPCTEYSFDQSNAQAFRKLFNYNENETNPHIFNHPYKDMVLPATSLAEVCYASMFQGCTNLTRAPELPAPTLISECYDSMFKGCSKLNYVKCLATSNPDALSTAFWLDGVAETGTFVTPAEMEWLSWVIPQGWTRVDYVAP